MKKTQVYQFQQRHKRDLKRLWHQRLLEKNEKNMFRTTQKPKLIKTGLEGVHHLLDDPAILRRDFHVADLPEGEHLFVFNKLPPQWDTPSNYKLGFSLRDQISIDLIGRLAEAMSIDTVNRLTEDVSYEN